MDNSYSNEPSNYIYPQSHIYADTKSIASYEEIFTPPKYEGKEHSYVCFDKPPLSRFCFDQDLKKKTFTFSIPVYVLIIFFTTLSVLSLIVILVLIWSDVIHINSPWKPVVVPDIIPYQGEEWFVPVDRWGMVHNYKTCKPFKIVTKITVTQIEIEDQACEDIKACENYLMAYDTNVTVRHRGELEYEFFFGNDKHVFEGRNWNCPYNPGELRLGYLGEEYDPEDLGPAWGNIRYTIIQYGIKNKLVAQDVCYDIDPEHKNCN